MTMLEKDQEQAEKVGQNLNRQLPQTNRDAYVGGKDSKVTYRIGDAVGAVLFIFAGMFDLISLVPLLNILSDILGECFFAIAFTLLRVPPFGKKTWLWYVATWIVELIPIASWMPMFIIMVFRFIAISRLEDRLKNELEKRGIDAKSEQTKAIAHGVLQQKPVQDYMKGREKTAVGNSARREDGSYDRDKIRDKRSRFSTIRGNLDTALTEKNPKIGGSTHQTQDPNSGIAAPAESETKDA